MTKTTLISFDIGTRNLAYCVLSYDDASSAATILEWGVADVHGGAGNGAMDRMTESVLELLESLTTSYVSAASATSPVRVLIENQPSMKNPSMKTVQIVIYSYFRLTRRVMSLDDHLSTTFVSPTAKLRCAVARSVLPQAEATPASQRAAYASRKRQALLAARAWLPETHAWRAHLDAHAKRDDLCDCLLQALAVVERDSRSHAPAAFGTV
jgi:hypothetical protein